MNDDDLTELLEAADGERPLPPGLEARLLERIRETAQLPPNTGPDFPSHGEVVDIDRPAPTSTGRPRRVVVTAAAAAVLVIAIVAGQSVSDGRAPAVPDPPPITAASAAHLGDLSDAQLCRRLARQLGIIGFDPSTSAEVPWSTELDGLADTIEEFADRTETHDLDLVITSLRATAIERREGTKASADGAFRRATDLLITSGLADHAC